MNRLYICSEIFAYAQSYVAQVYSRNSNIKTAIRHALILEGIASSEFMAVRIWFMWVSTCITADINIGTCSTGQIHQLAI